jgi:hypothetical protein
LSAEVYGVRTAAHGGKQLLFAADGRENFGSLHEKLVLLYGGNRRVVRLLYNKTSVLRNENASVYATGKDLA